MLKIYLQPLFFFSLLYLTSSVKKTLQLQGKNQQYNLDNFTKIEVSSKLQCTQKCLFLPNCYGINICKLGAQFECTLIHEEINQNSLVTTTEKCQAYRTINHGLICRKYVQDRCGPCLCFDSVPFKWRCECNIRAYEVELRSGGYTESTLEDSYFKLNGVKNIIRKRGFSIFLIDTVKALITSTRTFDTWGLESDKDKMVEYLDSVSNGTLIAIIVSDTAELFQPTESLRKLGATQPKVGYRSSYVLLCLKGTGSIAEHNGMDEKISSSEVTVEFQWKFNKETRYVELTPTETHNGNK